MQTLMNWRVNTINELVHAWVLIPYATRFFCAGRYRIINVRIDGERLLIKPFLQYQLVLLGVGVDLFNRTA